MQNNLAKLQHLSKLIKYVFYTLCLDIKFTQLQANIESQAIFNVVIDLERYNTVLALT